VKARLARDGAGLQVLVYLPDQRELFARICGFFGGAGLSILEAKVHTTRHGYALDTFVVHDPANPLASYRETIQYVEYELTRALADRARSSRPRKAAFRASCATFP
jgi:[protein-PII] uridylyltransferase